jgi:hypothetical protein
MSNHESLRLLVGDLIVFKDKATDILGVELDKFIAFFVEKVNLSKQLI